MIQKTQRYRIIEKLRADGEITTIWAVHNFILRLAARIAELEAEGWVFDRGFIEIDGRRTQSYRYRVVAAPVPTLGL